MYDFFHLLIKFLCSIIFDFRRSSRDKSPDRHRDKSPDRHRDKSADRHRDRADRSRSKDRRAHRSRWKYIFTCRDLWFLVCEPMVCLEISYWVLCFYPRRSPNSRGRSRRQGSRSRSRFVYLTSVPLCFGVLSCSLKAPFITKKMKAIYYRCGAFYNESFVCVLLWQRCSNEKRRQDPEWRPVQVNVRVRKGKFSVCFMWEKGHRKHVSVL